VLAVFFCAVGGECLMATHGAMNAHHHEVHTISVR
jgi:hypothetical protein